MMSTAHSRHDSYIPCVVHRNGAHATGFMFEVIDMNQDGFISAAEFAKFVHGVANIRSALQQWELVKQSVSSDSLVRASSGAADSASTAQLLGMFR
jgi:hypothetical protein